MEIEVVVNSSQIIEDITDKQNIKCKGTIQKFEKGTILEFGNEEHFFKMTLLNEKILLNRNNQKMIFEIGKITKSVLQTEYGMIDIEIITKKIEITENEDTIEQLILEYEIKLQDTIQYLNKVEMIIK